MYLGRELCHLWKTVAPAFGAEHDLSRADSWELIMSGEEREQGLAGTQVSHCLQLQ